MSSPPKTLIETLYEVLKNRGLKPRVKHGKIIISKPKAARVTITCYVNCVVMDGFRRTPFGGYANVPGVGSVSCPAQSPSPVLVHEIADRATDRVVEFLKNSSPVEKTKSRPKNTRQTDLRNIIGRAICAKIDGAIQNLAGISRSGRVRSTCNINAYPIEIGVGEDFVTIGVRDMLYVRRRVKFQPHNPKFDPDVLVSRISLLSSYLNKEIMKMRKRVENDITDMEVQMNGGTG